MFLLILLWLGTLANDDRARSGDPLTAVETQMTQAPLEAFAIARKALDELPATPDQITRLFALGARLQESRLRSLSPEAIVELANIHAKTLKDNESADRVRRNWLQLRTEALGPADGPGRVKLARFYLDWFQDKAAAATLCLDAARLAPELADAHNLLTRELGYEKYEKGWRQVTKNDDRNLAALLAQLRVATSSEDVRSILGAPDRRAQQIVFRRYREQWWYDSSSAIRIEFDCIKGQSPHVVRVVSSVSVR